MGNMETIIDSIRTEDSLKKRYFYKLVNNFAGIPFILVSQAIIPRGLGPEAYGSFSFLSNFFTQVTSFFDSGTSIGFYSKLSQRPDEVGLKIFYWRWVFIVTLLLVILVLGAIGLGLTQRLWPGQETIYIMMATVWGLLTWYTEIVSKVIDAHGLTIGGEVVRLLQKVLGLILLVMMLKHNVFGLADFFSYHYIILLFLLGGWRWVLNTRGIQLLPKEQLSHEVNKRYAREFYDYSSPLLVYALMGMLVGVLDRWFLQAFSGSVEQGYYGLSYQISAISFLFTGAMTPLLMREFSQAAGQNDRERMRSLFMRFIPLFYFVTTYFSVFLCFQAETVSLIFGGKQFTDASHSVAIISLYPIYQTYGQLSGAVFYATGETKRYRNIGITTFLIGLPVTFFLLAPVEWFGLSLGAVGLSLKMVVMAFVAVNVQLYYNALFLKISLKQLLSHQFLTLVMLACLAFLSETMIRHIFTDVYFLFVFSGLVYTILTLLICYTFPSFLCRRRSELRAFINFLRNYRFR